jgi:hypothetical protein
MSCLLYEKKHSGLFITQARLILPILSFPVPCLGTRHKQPSKTDYMASSFRHRTRASSKRGREEDTTTTTRNSASEKSARAEAAVGREPKDSCPPPAASSPTSSLSPLAAPLSPPSALVPMPAHAFRAFIKGCFKAPLYNQANLDVQRLEENKFSDVAAWYAERHVLSQPLLEVLRTQCVKSLQSLPRETMLTPLKADDDAFKAIVGLLNLHMSDVHKVEVSQVYNRSQMRAYNAEFLNAGTRVLGNIRVLAISSFTACVPKLCVSCSRGWTRVLGNIRVLAISSFTACVPKLCVSCSRGWSRRRSAADDAVAWNACGLS